MNAKNAQCSKPTWLKSSLPGGEQYFAIKKDLRVRHLATVCEEAKCPNIGECWNTRTATFMLMGDTCTRACRFCHIKTHAAPALPDKDEPRNVAESCQTMRLKYVVMTMVNRDDLPDGGAGHIASVVQEVKALNPSMDIELLVGDFGGNENAIRTVVNARVQVYAHNLETVERLSPRVRDARAHYQQSLQTLRLAKETADYKLYTKSALMLGLGERWDEIRQAMADLREHNVDFLTIGQYMRPTKKHLTVKQWVHPDIFAQLKAEAETMGFKGVASAPLVRSSYKAAEFFKHATSVC
ncbi:MAG: lipoyl synthase [Deltaproteobacteria bacterium]|nr:lipoyl synthase [Deltaproteobacteria bacterium]